MFDFLETLFGILVIVLFAILGIILFVAIAVVMSPVLIIIILILSIAFLWESIINLIRVCKGKEEKHLINIEFKEGDENDKRGKDI